MRKWLAFLIVGILLLSILQGGHGGIDFLLMFVLFLIDNRAGHFVLVLIVLVPLGSMIWGGHVRSRRDSEQAMKQMVEVIRQRTAAMEARIALLEGRAPGVEAEGGKDGNQTVRSAEEGVAKGVAVVSGFGTAAAGSSLSPGKAGPDQARGSGVAAPRDVGGRVKPEDAPGDGGAGMARPVCGLGEDGCLRVLSRASVGRQCPSVCLWGAKARSARGLIPEVRDAPMNDVGTHVSCRSGWAGRADRA